MPVSADVGVNATLSVTSNATVYTLPVELQGTSATFNRAVQPIILATGAANSLVGYTPSTGASSGFQIAFALPYLVNNAGAGATPGAFLNALLYTAGVTCKMQLGNAGGVTLAGCYCNLLEVTGAEGGFIHCRATFDATAVPTVGATVAAVTFLDVYKFVDTTSIQLPGGVAYTDVHGFTFRVRRTITPYKGNSTTGIAKRLAIVRTESEIDADYLKVSDVEATAAVSTGPNYCPTRADSTIILTQVCGGSQALTMVCTSSFHGAYPQNTSSTESYITERSHVMGFLGAYSIT